VGYGRDVYDLRERLAGVRDSRQEPVTSADLVAASIFFCGLLRVRSLNALEPKLGEKTFRRLVGAPPQLEVLRSADTLSRSLRKMALETVRGVSLGMVTKAERNKVFREGWVGALRYMALDGWEPIRSWLRHCKHCLTRQVKMKGRRGEIVERTEYYHRFAVALLIDERFDLALDIEPVLPKDLRAGPERDKHHEGELTAARRLLRRVKKTFSWIDVVVADGLYPNGPFLTDVQQLGMSSVIVLQKDTDEPLKEALALWADKPTAQVVRDEKSGECIELWDCPQIQTLDTYRGPIRVVRARVTPLSDPKADSHTWCLAVTGEAATRLSARQVLRVARGRWKIENTGFHQWTTRWRFAHVFVHDADGLLALYWLFFAAFNLLTFFLYRQLRCYGRDRGKNVTRTISRLVDEMLDDLARLDCSPWDPDPG